MTQNVLSLALLGACLAILGGCGRVDRTVTVTSEPPGAIVFLNDNEIGRTPVTTHFTWYGTYRVRLEKEGYATLTAAEPIRAPWFQWVPLDLAFDTIIPGTHHDDHQLGPYKLEPVAVPPSDVVLKRAQETRRTAVEGDLSD